MDREGRRRYFIFGSAILEIVTPVFKDRLNTECNGNLQTFMNTQPVIHKMFHLRHRYVWCCVDQPNCTNNSALPLNSNQWNSLYAENPGPGRHHCHCKYTAKPIQLDDLDLTLAGLILVNCCNLPVADEQAVRILRQYRNNYFAHNTDGTIAQADYDRLWPFLTAYVLQLDNSKQADLTMIKNRPLDESVCNKYATQLLDVHKRLDEIDNSIEGNNVLTQQNSNLLNGLTTSSEANNDLTQQNNNLLNGLTTSSEANNDLTQENNNLLNGLTTSSEANNILIQATSNIVTGLNTSTAENNAIARENNELLKGVNNSMQVLLHYAEKGMRCRCQQDTNIQGEVKSKPYKLGQSIFKLHHQIDLSTVTSGIWEEFISDGVMMDDGRLVLCQPNRSRLLICNTDVSVVDSIPVNDRTECVTAVNNTTVAVTLLYRDYIEMYDINNKHKLKSIQVPGMLCWGITTINNKLVVGGEYCLYIIDHQTEEKIQTINTGDCDPDYLHTSGDRIFYCEYNDNNLYCYNYTEDKVTKTSLPSQPWRITSLQDGSLYVICEDESVQHVSSDGKQYKPVTEGLKSLNYCYVFSYNPKQGKLFTYTHPGQCTMYAVNV